MNFPTLVAYLFFALFFALSGTAPHAVLQPVGLGAITRGTDKLTNSVMLVTLCLSNFCTQDVTEVMAIRMRVLQPVRVGSNHSRYRQAHQ